ncbi:hypothetical protein ABI59_22790 [Acidobacteria bacterium Mor1]|nr:hypothetical protein ABI59_22790 [Acidobacteria bacterium Mor1]
MNRIQAIGLLLWRGGLLFAGSWAAFLVARQLIRVIALPAQVEVGAGLMLAGMLLVLVSLVMERIEDARREGDLSR